MGRSPFSCALWAGLVLPAISGDAVPAQQTVSHPPAGQCELSLLPAERMP